MTDYYAVVGDPIAHSKSPLIHRLFAEQTHQDLVYEAIRVDTEDTTFQWAMADLKTQGYKGLNITVPYKLDAFEYADELTERAQVAHAVNTFQFQDGKTLGDNTDGVGLVMDIEINAACPFEGKQVLILGAGGAVQGVLQPILENGQAWCILPIALPSVPKFWGSASIPTFPSPPAAGKTFLARPAVTTSLSTAPRPVWKVSCRR